MTVTSRRLREPWAAQMPRTADANSSGSSTFSLIGETDNTPSLSGWNSRAAFGATRDEAIPASEISNARAGGGSWTRCLRRSSSIRRGTQKSEYRTQNGELNILDSVFRVLFSAFCVLSFNKRDLIYLPER